MRLYEFFGNINQESTSHGLEKEQERQLADQVFWYILDSDQLHKTQFLHIAKKIKQAHEADPKEASHDCKVWLPMVIIGCREYFEKNDIQGDPKDIFNKKFRMDLCKHLAQHFHEDILKDTYKLGH